jgi:NDP-hexose-3-ketoreductase
MSDKGTDDTAPIRFGVLGCASIAERRMLPALTSRAEASLVAIASRDAARAAAFTARFGGEPVTGYQQLLDRPDIEAVYLPLPVLLHAEWIERALLAGKHVLAEKPLTADPAQSRRLVALAAERGLVLVENFMFLRHSQHATVRKLLADGAIGCVRSLTADLAFPPPSAERRRYRPQDGGSLLELGVYPLRTTQLYLGDELEPLGGTTRRDQASGIDVAGSALLTTPDGTTAALNWGMEHSYRSAYELWGSTGRLVVEWAYTPVVAHPPVIRIERADRLERLVLPPDDQFGNVVTAFAHAVRHGTDTGLQGTPILQMADLVAAVRAVSREFRTQQPGADRG